MDHRIRAEVRGRIRSSRISRHPASLGIPPASQYSARYDPTGACVVYDGRARKLFTSGECETPGRADTAGVSFLLSTGECDVPPMTTSEPVSPSSATHQFECRALGRDARSALNPR